MSSKMKVTFTLAYCVSLLYNTSRRRKRKEGKENRMTILDVSVRGIPLSHGKEYSP